MLNPDIFRQFSIRGLADQDLTDEDIMLIGRAAGSWFLRHDISSLVIGHDGRLSSPRISHALIDSLLSTGIDVCDIGLTPTPIHNFAVDEYRAGGGIMITASHNPAAYNGLKLRGHMTLSAEAIQEILNLAQKEDFISGQGRLRTADPRPPYEAALRQHAHLARPLKVVIDAGNGVNGLVMPEVLRRLGCRVDELFCEVDGNFPHRDPDPTAKDAARQLAAMVKAGRADLGVAYDGDGDRMIIVDDTGERLFGDQLMIFLAREILATSSQKIVYEVLCSQALVDDIRAHGGIPIGVPSGYAFVHEAMIREGAALGGEMSGHFFLDKPRFRFDDAMLATVIFLSILSRQQKPLSALRAELPAYPSSPEIRLACPDHAKSSIIRQVKERFKRYPIDELDGARFDFGDGWALVRPSNTQPVISMRFEARTASALELIQQTVLPFVQQAIAAKSGNSIN
jgi:phosphomannomutase / phosphoglucomutase